jgi:glycosyltransferase involved in cell wall biosynthesis
MQSLLIDTRELRRRPITSLGIILRDIIPLLASEYRLLLVSDIPPEGICLDGVNSLLIYGKEATKGFEVLKYHHWIKETIEDIKPDIYFQINHFVPFRLYDTITIAEIHDLFPLKGLYGGKVTTRLAFYNFLLETLKNSKYIVVPSQFMKSELERTFSWVAKDRISVIPSPWPNAPHKIKKPNLVGENDSFLLFLGRISRMKGVDILLDLAESGMIPSSQKLVLAGKLDDVKLGSKIQKIIDRNEIIYLDFVSDEEKEYLLNKATIFLYPTRYDGFGIPPIEATLRGAPAIVSNIQVMYEHFLDLGFYVNINDVNRAKNELCAKIKDIMEMPKDVLAKKINALRNKFLVYSPENYVSYLIEIFDRAAKKDI